MPWQNGYYYRARKVGGRVVREYMGSGPDAVMAAQLDAMERQKREQERTEQKALVDELESISNSVSELGGIVDGIARASLVVAGYRQHKRGQWRKKRERN